MSPEPGDEDIPTLTEVVAFEGPSLGDEAFEELHAELTTRVLSLAEELLQGANREMADVLLERVMNQLRERLPDIVDEALRARLAPSSVPTAEEDETGSPG